MKKSKSLVLLAVSAVLAMAFIAPAAASASGEWLQNGEPFEGKLEAPYIGSVTYDYGGYVSCTFEGTAVFEGGSANFKVISAGQPSEWSEAEIAGCVGWGLAEGCVGEPLGENLPWQVTRVAASKEFHLNDFGINSQFHHGEGPGEPWHPCEYPNLAIEGVPTTGEETVGYLALGSSYQPTMSGVGNMRQINGFQNNVSGGYELSFEIPGMTFSP